MYKRSRRERSESRRKREEINGVWNATSKSRGSMLGSNGVGRKTM
jgi:hypothetical protein